MRKSVAAISLGSNLGDRAALLRKALASLALLPGTRVVVRSAFLETDAVGPPQPRFLNGAAILETTLSPEALLGALLGIESALGRMRSVEKGPRVIDLDLLTYGQNRSHTVFLSLPHPQLHRREFVLEPLSMIAPKLMVPGRGRVSDLLAKIRG
ncbi:MAG: 2-amino-4-hydroxy-6-hydroxymethyldihydropteridine [Planctomycetota bacterium]|nr:MAG: 2-amino-4-hydroxy-6-hydroxymethyldihydropteridine [Planctomycetota bacterium]